MITNYASSEQMYILSLETGNGLADGRQVAR